MGVEIKINMIDEEGRGASRMPEKALPDAAAYDAFVSQIVVNPDGLIRYKLGFRTEIPSGYKGTIVPRSSLTNTLFVMQNGEGVVDSDYRGEWEFRIRPMYPDWTARGLSGETIGAYSWRYMPYNIGDACCQIYFEKEVKVFFNLCDELSETERGEGGFGHTTNKKK